MPKILIIRFSSIGDIVLTTPIIRTVKNQLHAEVHFLVKPAFHAILSHNPYIDHLISYTKENTSIIDQLKAENYDCVIDLQKNVKSYTLTQRLGIKTYTFDKLNVKKWIFVNTKLNLLPDKHIVHRYFEGIEPLGVKDDGLGLDFFWDIAEEDKALSMMEGIIKYQILILGANYYTKRIPEEICRKIIEKSEWTTVLIGGKDVEQVANKLSDEYPDATLNFVGKVNINVSAALIKHAKRIITGDTGMMHIAAALQKDMFVLWGNTVPDFGMYPYYGEKSEKSATYMEVLGLGCRPCSKLGYNTCPKSHFKCMMDQDMSPLTEKKEH